MCAENVFHFICNGMTDVSIILKDGLHLNNDGTRVLENKSLKIFQGNIDFNVNSKIN